MEEEVLEVLNSKHLETCPDTKAICSFYTVAPPGLLPLDVTAYKVTDVVWGRTLSGSITSLYNTEKIM